MVEATGSSPVIRSTWISSGVPVYHRLRAAAGTARRDVHGVAPLVQREHLVGSPDHSRMDTAEESFRPRSSVGSSSRLVSGRSRVRIVAGGTRSMSCSSSWPRTPDFQSGDRGFESRTRCQFGAGCGCRHACPGSYPGEFEGSTPFPATRTRSFVISRARRKPAAKIGRPRNSSPGRIGECCPSGRRGLPAKQESRCTRGREFESRTFRQQISVGM